MGEVRTKLEAHLAGMAAPFLFVGSGVSLRYAGLDTWEGLLRRFAKLTDKPYEYYRGAAGANLPATASLIADAFYEIWWTRPEYEVSRNKFGGTVTDGSSALKIEIANYLIQEVNDLKVPAAVKDEFEAFKSIIVDGLITTNYDSLLEVAFPEYRAYIGQDELVFSDTQGIGEMYYIHGSVREPETLVLTAKDYEDFNSRNAYLAAKLLTIFVEHPVVFLGYSLGDQNVQDILQSIALGLRPENLVKLQNRLIFVDWKPGASPSFASTVMQIAGSPIPVIQIRVEDFTDIFAALSVRQRAMPARVLRLLKEQVYEIVKSSHPEGRLVTISDIDGDKASELEVVFGVGAKISRVGIVGLTRFDIIDDVLESPDRDLDPLAVLNEAIPRVPTNAYAPVFKYLRASDFLNADGSVRKGASAHANAIERAKKTKGRLAGMALATVDRTIGQLESDEGWEWVFNHAMEIPTATTDIEGMREFLIRHKAVRTRTWFSTQYAKLAVVYDWMRYGRDVT